MFGQYMEGTYTQFHALTSYEKTLGTSEGFRPCPWPRYLPDRQNSIQWDFPL